MRFQFPYRPFLGGAMFCAWAVVSACSRARGRVQRLCLLRHLCATVYVSTGTRYLVADSRGTRKVGTETQRLPDPGICISARPVLCSSGLVLRFSMVFPGQRHETGLASALRGAPHARPVERADSKPWERIPPRALSSAAVQPLPHRATFLKWLAAVAEAVSVRARRRDVNSGRAEQHANGRALWPGPLRWPRPLDVRAGKAGGAVLLVLNGFMPQLIFLLVSC